VRQGIVASDTDYDRRARDTTCVAHISTKPTAAGTDGLDIVRLLSQYRPFERGGAGPREAQEDLLLAALAEAGGSCASPVELRDYVHALCKVDLHQAEVDRALGQLIRESRIVRKDGALCLSGVQAERGEATARESRENAATAIAEWRAFVAASWPGLTGEQLDILEGQLRTFLLQVARRHGAEAATVLYPDDPEVDRRYDELEKAGLGYVEPVTDPEVAVVQAAALSHFIRHPSNAQKEFLGRTLNTAYFLSVLSIDPAAAALVRDIASGQIVFLDTNFIYRVLGIQGPRHLRAARTILDTTKEVGYRCCVTPWTIEEFKRSLERARDHVNRYPVPSSEYAALLADATSDEDFVTAYWQQARDSPIKIDDFYAHWREVEVHLQSLGVEIHTDGCAAIEAQTDAVTDEISILGKALAAKPKPGKAPANSYRHPELLAHDVQHRLLIRRLRGAGNRTFANGGYWFLTFDSVLPRYDHQARRGTSEILPFCVSAGAWFQIVEAFRPKTEDVLSTLADLLASPYVRYRRTLSKAAAEDVVARVRLHKGGNPDLAARIMMNSIFVKEIEATEPDSAERVERIDNAIVAAAQQAQEDARRAQEAAERERRGAQMAREQSRTELHEAQAKHADELQRTSDQAEQAREADRKRHEKELAAQAEEREAEARQLQEDAATEIKAERESRLKAERRLRGFVAAVLAICVAVVLVLAVGVDQAWAVAVIIFTMFGFVAALDQLWIRRQR
jgi:predicted nucleic acid-binding protein